MTNEEWRSVAGYEGLYEVSNYGRVRTVARITPSSYRGKPVIRHIGQKIKRTSIDAYGYPMVQLVKDKREHSEKIHRLVAIAFLGPKPTDFDIHHKDENKHNNNLSNLEYIDHRLHLSQHNKGKHTGSKNVNAVLEEDEVFVIKQLIQSSVFSPNQIAKAFGVSSTTISHIKTGKSWTN